MSLACNGQVAGMLKHKPGLRFRLINLIQNRFRVPFTVASDGNQAKSSVGSPVVMIRRIDEKVLLL